MKKIYLLLAALCTLSFTGCNDDDDQMNAAKLEIVESEIGFDAAGGNGKITLRTSESTVKAVSDKSWLTISKATPESVTYSLVANSDALQRTANITITAGGENRVVSILQNGAVFKISSDPIAVSPSGESPSYIAYDTSLGSMPEVSLPTDVKWLKPTVEEGRIKLEADLNYTGARNTVLTVVQGWKPVEIAISQEMVDLVDTKQIIRDREATEVIVTPTQYLAMASATWDVQTADDWFTLTKEADKIKVNIPENNSGALRKGTIKVVSGEGKELISIPVSQQIYSYEFFLGNWMMVYGDSKGIYVTLTKNADGSGYIADMAGFEVSIGYEDRGTVAALTITTPQHMGLYNYNSGTAQANIFLFPTTTSGVDFNKSEGIGYDCIYVLNQGKDLLMPQANAATNEKGLTIQGLIFAGQDTKTNDWVNFGNYHPFIGMMRAE